MTKFYRRITTGIATTAMIVANFAPVFAATELSVIGNGSDSTSNISLNQGSTTFVTQTNVTSINNDVDIDADTGSNTADDNTGGDVLIDTGNSTAKVTIENMANSNVAEVEPCNCEGDTDVLIEGNASGTDNDVRLRDETDVVLTQTNVARVDNDVDVDLETGDNRAGDNTGGDVEIYTGDAKAEISAKTMVNMNSASIVPSGDGGSLSVIIRENGSDSDNDVVLGLGSTTWLDQFNATSVENDFDVDAETGDNKADDNTGGSSLIDTGDATIKAIVENMGGFNTANVEDCCFDDVLAKIAGNATDSENEIKATLGADLVVWQDNLCGYGLPYREAGDKTGFPYPSPKPCFDNDLDLDADTGDNRNEDNTNGSDADPAVYTGNTLVEVGIDNQGGVNSYGVGTTDSEWDWDWPSMGFEFSFSFDLQDLLEALM